MIMSNKIRICYMDAYPYLGGGQIHLLSLMERLDKERFETILCCNVESEIGKVAKNKGFPVYHVRIGRPWDVRPLIQMLKLFHNHKVDIIHAQDFQSCFIAALASRLAGIPHVLWTVHVTNLHRSVQGIPLWKRQSYILIDKVLSKLIDKFITVSNANKVSLIKEEGIPADKIVTIYNGVDLAKFNPDSISDEVILSLKEDLGITDEFIIGVVTRLAPEKGLEYLFKALKILDAKFSRWRCVVVGDGELKEHLQQRTKEEGIDAKIHFLGWKENPLAYYRLFDVFVLPSLFEGLPLVLLESLAMQCPVIATTVQGNPEVVRHGEVGLLVPPRSPDALAAALLTLLNNREELKRMGQAGRKLVEKRFNLVSMVEQYENIYTSLVKLNQRC